MNDHQELRGEIAEAISKHLNTIIAYGGMLSGDSYVDAVMPIVENRLDAAVMDARLRTDLAEAKDRIRNLEERQGWFYLVAECDCEEDILHGPNLTTELHNDTPVIPFDIAAQTVFRCDCGKELYTGDFDTYSDPDE